MAREVQAGDRQDLLWQQTKRATVVARSYHTLFRRIEKSRDRPYP